MKVKKGEKKMNDGLTLTPVKNPELNRVQEESDMALKNLIDTVAQLTSRLSKVMGPAMTELVNEQENPKYFSELAQDIDSHNLGLWSVTRSLRTVLDRLEI
jgi:hypothetical protein